MGHYLSERQSQLAIVRAHGKGCGPALFKPSFDRGAGLRMRGAACGIRCDVLDFRVFLSKWQKPRDRFYLLPGQGGRNYRRKQERILRWSILVAVLMGTVLAAVMWWFAQPRF